MPTKIEWCDETVNPVVGCSKCSPGCLNCYAEQFAARLAKNPNPKIAAKYARVVDARGRWTGRVNGQASLGRLPNAPQSIFINSMTDLFYEEVPPRVLENLCSEMAQWPQHRFLLLTKRAERLPDWTFGTENLWIGVTVCNQDEADEKIPLLLAAEAAHKFISVEPMLGGLDIATWLRCKCPRPGFLDPQALMGSRISEKLDWVICGGETGAKARPVHPDWVRSLRDQCQEAGVPFFFKGWGEWGYAGGNSATHALSHDGRCYACTPGRDLSGAAPVKKWGRQNNPNGRRLDGVEHNERPW